GSKQPEIILLDPKSGSQTHELRGHSRSVTCVKWSPSSEYLLASGSEDSRILFWDIRSAKGYLQTLDQHNGERGSNQNSVTAHSGIVCSLQFTSDSLHLVSYGTDSQLRLWDVALCANTLVNFGRVHNSSRVRQRIIDLCCDSNPQLVFVPSANNVQIFDLLTGCRVKKLFGHFCDVHCCVFRSGAQQLYSAGNDMNILFWTPDLAQEIEEEACMPKGSKRNIHEHSPHSDFWSSDED
ncbi:DNA excision repair protein ERCC-8-like, partial [Stegodyphus dumicola]|uniref:DNA excision repair protein ERCC-8-like n=1 Tax=Stegodyphus dumicola TaxID=202533 RepID=UPI0015A929FF